MKSDIGHAVVAGGRRPAGAWSGADLGRPTWIRTLSRWSGHPSPDQRCLPPDQRVLTPLGYLPIAEIAPGDAVISGLGWVRPVVAVRCAEVEEPLFHLRTAGGHLLRATGDHRVLARRDEGVPEWIRASALSPGTQLAIVGRTVLTSGGAGWGRPPRPGEGGPGLATMAREESAVYFGVDWVPLIAADSAPYRGPVHDLAVGEDRSFVSDGVVCGACGCP